MGGSSVYLAHQGCQVTGITLSSVQRRWATTSAWLGRVGSKTEFLVADVEKVTFPDEHFDVAWSIECTEHVFDKQKLFENLFRWLKPGGRLGICVWLAGPASDQEAGRKLVERVCDDFFCPSLGTTEDYVGWMKNAGFKDMQAEMWTDQVLQTWEICKRRVRRTGVRWIAQVIDRDQVRFIDAFDTILTAYRTRAMEYGCITATKPS